MKRALVSLACLLFLACSSAQLMDGASTIYRSPEKARTALTAMQTLRYHSAQLVAKACVEGRVTRAQCDQFGVYDGKFTAAWAKASELVQLWLASKGTAPAGMNASMNDVERTAANIEEAARVAE